MTLEKARTILKRAEAERQAIGPVSDLFEGGLTLDQAHDICEASIAERIAAGDPLRGFKVGFTNIPVRDKMGLPDSTYGYLLESMVLPSGGTLAMSELIAPRIECEICFRLAKPLSGKGLSIGQVLDATDAVAAAFEICDARIRDWKCPYPDFFADNGFSARIVLEGSWHDVRDVDLLGESVVLSQDGVQIAEGRGEMAMGHPANAVSWLAGKLADRGKGLEAGQLVMTGTLTPILTIEADSTYEAAFSTLGTVTKAFA
ncbi:MAG: 2-keto-4-pentenoate hydratase [Anaerolineae bacterium]|jgi:2-keto-4-pentenoate hydratase